MRTATLSSDTDEEDGGTRSGACCVRAPAELQRVREKLANLPTLQRLLSEPDPNAYTPEQLTSAASFVRELVARAPRDEADVARVQRQLQKTHHVVYKKSLLLAGYKHLLRTHNNNDADDTAADEDDVHVTTQHGDVDMEDMVTTTSAAKPSSSPQTRSTTTTSASCRCVALERFLVSKAPRSQSGVLVVTVFTSPYPDGARFSCQWNCYYCPNEPGQPRSYLLNEPGVRRANKLQFDPYRQFCDRVRSLRAIGHPVDKVELMVLGGTWESYPPAYRERFVRDLFYAANTVFDDDDEGEEGEECLQQAEQEKDTDSAQGTVPRQQQQQQRRRRRPATDLLHEQLLNETARCKVIGLTLETRPDTVTHESIVELRRLGCTRVQLGVQHTDDAVLAKVNRGATREDTMRALKLLKDNCYKVDIHLMPDLPGSTPALDKAMFDDVLSSPYLQADQWKLYPCQTTPFTVIEQWYRDGTYTPYGLDALIDVLLYVKRRVHPWVRLNRVVRDIPADYVLAGVEVANLRQLLARRLAAEGCACRCIRCREVKGDADVAAKLPTAVLRERTYAASEGTEVFLSYETDDERTIFAFLRLRLHVQHSECAFAELRDCALVRELHVYGNLITTAGEGDVARRAQHAGLGTRLLQRAEALARAAGYTRIAVISGVGVRAYYRKKGYALHEPHRGGFMIKQLPDDERATATTDAVTAACGGGDGDDGGVTAPSPTLSGCSRDGQGLLARVQSWWTALRKRVREDDAASAATAAKPPTM